MEHIQSFKLFENSSQSLEQIEKDLQTFIPTQLEKEWESPSGEIQIDEFPHNWFKTGLRGKKYVTAAFRDLGHWELEYDETNRWQKGEEEKYYKEFQSWAKKFDWYNDVILEIDVQAEYEMTIFKIILIK